MSALRTPYQILQVAPDADPAVIEAAFKALIKKYHPDLFAHDPAAQHRAASLNEAWATLKDPDLREACDREMRARKFAAPVIAPAPAPRRSGRGKRWWTGWLAALIVGGAQFVPWESILGDDGSRSERFVDASEAPSSPPASLIAKAEAAEAAYAATIRARPLTREEEDWAPLPASTPSPPAAANLEQAPRVRAPEASRRAPAAAPRAPQRPRRERRAASPRAEKEFLEREGYIY